MMSEMEQTGDQDRLDFTSMLGTCEQFWKACVHPVPSSRWWTLFPSLFIYTLICCGFQQPAGNSPPSSKRSDLEEKQEEHQQKSETAASSQQVTLAQAETTLNTSLEHKK